MPTSARTSPAADLPRRVGRYVFLRQIGAGGMGRVFLASVSDPNGARELVAIQQLNRGIAEDQRVLATFLGEARVSTRLAHPNVVRTREVVAVPPDYYLVMEFLAGQSLFEIVRRAGWQAIPRDLQIWFLTQVLAGLEHAHELSDLRGQALGIVHCDVSPSNVVVCYDGQVKLLDFGIAKATGALTTTLERPVRGKLGYIAPEQCLGEPADPRSDLYAVGVMLWEAIAGRRRSPPDDPSSILRARIESSEQALERVCPDAPPELLAIVQRALARLPAARYGTAREFRLALERYLASLPNAPGPTQAALLLARHFAQERAWLKAAIEAAGAVPVASLSALEPLPVASLPQIEAAADAVPAQTVPPDGFGDEQEEITSPVPVDDALLVLSRPELPRPPGLDALRVPTAARSRAWLWVAAGVVVGAASVALVIGAAGTTSSAPEAPFPARPRGQSAFPAAPRPGVNASPLAVNAGAKIALRIAVKPTDATVRLDGRLLKGNPFLTTVERDALEHEISVSAEDYRTEKRVLRFDEDIDLQLHLEPLKNEAPPPVSRGSRSPSRQSPSSEGRPSGQRLEPGMELEPQKDTRSRRKIDERDPYTQ
jgi:eukaryotic-like serine/threonine-protein kinase